MSRLLRCGLVSAVAGLVLAASLPARGDIFTLGSGGQIEGEWINADEQPLTKYIIRTAAGVTIELAPGQVADHRRPLPAERQYDQIAPTYGDTVEEQWKLAEWCRQMRLSAQRVQHLARIVELDPNHQQARALLGYAFIDGQWVLRPDHKREQGLELYRGRWRTPQEIALLESESKRELLEKEWLAKLQRWRKLLDTEKGRQAYDSIRTIDDPIAVRPLIHMFRRETVRAVKTLYADVLAGLNTRQSIEFLVHATLSDPDLEVFDYCLAKLIGRQVPHLAEKYVDALRDPNNERVNRAAVALSRIGDRSVIQPLIDALVTVHQRTLPGRPGLGPDATAATFSADGNASFSKNEGPQIQIVRVQNQQVLEALTKLSGGATFGFNQKAWAYWYAQEKQAEARRGTDTLSRRQE